MSDVPADPDQELFERRIRTYLTEHLTIELSQQAFQEHNGRIGAAVKATLLLTGLENPISTSKIRIDFP